MLHSYYKVPSQALALVNCTPSAVDPYGPLVFYRHIDKRALW